MTVTFPDKVRQTMERHAMTREGDLVVAAVSGGPDSCAMLGALRTLTPVLEIRVMVAHLDHQLRGESGREDARFVTELARRFDLPLAARAIDVRELARTDKTSIETAGRKARYNFLQSVALEYGGAAVAVAHTREDRVETFFLHLFRGTGPEGLTSMRPVRPLTETVRLLRPLLGCTHEEAKAFNHSIGLPSCTDATNTDTRHVRNRIRHCLLPIMREEYCPHLDRNIERLTQIWEAESDYVEDQASRAMRSISKEALDSDLTEKPRQGLDRSEFLSLPRPLQRRILRQAYHEARGHREDLVLQHVENLLNWLQSGANNGLWTLPGGVEVHVQGKRVVVGSRAASRRREAGRTFLQIPGVTRTEEFGLVMEARLFEYGINEPFPCDVNTVWVDSARVDELWLRCARPGDRFRPLGCDGTQKLQDFFVNTKVPRHRRWRTPVVVSADQIVWVVGHRLDDQCKISKETKTALELRAVPSEGR